MRENNTGRFPRGLSLMLRSLSAWLYEGDPVEILRFEEPLAKLKARMAKEDVFTPLIKKMLIDNTHKVTIELNPDKELGKVQDEEEKAKVAAYRGSLPEEIEKVVADTEELKRLQETPDSPRRSRASPHSTSPISPRRPSPSPRTSPPSVPPPCSPTISSPTTSSTPNTSW